jgi:hypothetical protein
LASIFKSLIPTAIGTNLQIIKSSNYLIVKLSNLQII